MHTPAPLASPTSVFSAYNLVSFGDIVVPPHPLRFGFQVDIVPSQNECRQVVFALLCKDSQGSSEAPTSGFAIRVDLQTGEVWDLLNDSGLIGWVEKPMEAFTEEEPMLFNWEVEHFGSALIPRLQIGDEVFLYPALYHNPGLQMTTVAGTEAGLDSAPAFLHPAVWKEAF